MKQGKVLYIIVLTVCFILALVSKSYGSTIQWQNTIGGNGAEMLESMQQTNDGGYILGGYSLSNISGDKIENSNGSYDYWVVKLNSLGNIQWQNTIGGDTTDYLYSIQQTNDGGYILGGSSNSDISGDKTENSKGIFDYWLVKLDALGNIQWQKTIGGSGLDDLASVQQTSDGGYVLGGSSGSNISGDKTENGYGNYDYWVIKTDVSGNIEWQKTIGGINNDQLKNIQQTNDGGYILGGISNSEISGNKTEDSIGSFDYWVVKIDNSGNIEWQNTIGGNNQDQLSSIQQTNDGGYILGGSSGSNISGDKTENSIGLTDIWVVKLDTSGNIQWQNTIGGNEHEGLYNIQQTSDVGYIIGGISASNISGDKTENSKGGQFDYWILKLDSLGNIQWQKTIGGSDLEIIESVQQTNNGGYVIAGYSTSNISGDKTENSFGWYDYWIVKLSGDPRYITGNIFLDHNNDCIEDVNDDGMTNFSLKASFSNNNPFFITTGQNGKYYLEVSDTGLYNIQLLPNVSYPYFTPSACNTYSVYLRDSIDTINFGMHPTMACPYNTVNISTSSIMRIGRTSTYYVSYCNNGTVASPNTYITVKLDSSIQFNNANMPFTIMPDKTYRFDVGNIDMLSCGSFTFDATPIIGSTIIGQTLCAEAHIYPDNICTVSNYTGANIVASAQCLGDSVRFQLQNTGGNMTAPKKYIVIEGNVMRINRNYQLNGNQSLTETLKADSGSTYRIIAERETDFPNVLGDLFTTAAVENCQPIASFPTGFFTQFPNYDGEPFRSMSCNVIIGSYDPNDKVASPVGYKAQHYIEANTAIDYQINFQNTGNDTAFKVIIVDTISSTLDINSIQLGAASHNYQFQRTDSNVVQFVFDSIMLVDSFRNEALSHGFIKFKIQQKANNPDGTMIYNKANIYFDYNAPVTTNQTYHTIGRDFIEIRLLSSTLNSKFNVKEVKIFPNPFRDKTQIIVESDVLKNASLLLMNIEGRLLKTIPSTTPNVFDIYREDLTNGMYIFKILQDNETIATGKLVVQ